MRSEALKPAQPMASLSGGMGSGDKVGVGYEGMGNMAPAFPGGYPYDMYGMGMMYGYGYPGMLGATGAGGSEQGGLDQYARNAQMYGMMPGFQPGMMGAYGGGQHQPGSDPQGGGQGFDPSAAGMYGYGAGQGWSGQQ